MSDMHATCFRHATVDCVLCCDEFMAFPHHSLSAEVRPHPSLDPIQLHARIQHLSLYF
jgi:hypothetical protein